MLGERRHTRERSKCGKVPPVRRQRQVLRVPRQDRRVQQRITEIAEQMRRDDGKEIVEQQRGDEEIANRRKQHRPLTLLCNGKRLYRRLAVTWRTGSSLVVRAAPRR